MILDVEITVFRGEKHSERTVVSIGGTDSKGNVAMRWSARHPYNPRVFPVHQTRGRAKWIDRGLGHRTITLERPDGLVCLQLENFPNAPHVGFTGTGEGRHLACPVYPAGNGWHLIDWRVKGTRVGADDGDFSELDTPVVIAGQALDKGLETIVKFVNFSLSLLTYPTGWQYVTSATIAAGGGAGAGAFFSKGYAKLARSAQGGGQPLQLNYAVAGPGATTPGAGAAVSTESFPSFGSNVMTTRAHSGGFHSNSWAVDSQLFEGGAIMIDLAGSASAGGSVGADTYLFLFVESSHPYVPSSPSTDWVKHLEYLNPTKIKAGFIGGGASAGAGLKGLGVSLAGMLGAVVRHPKLPTALG